MSTSDAGGGAATGKRLAAVWIDTVILRDAGLRGGDEGSGVAVRRKRVTEARGPF